MTQPLVSLAKTRNSEAILLGSEALNDVLIAAPIGIVGVLLYYDLRARRGGGRS